MTLRREVEARGAFALQETVRGRRIARLERAISRRSRVIEAHRKHIDRLLSAKELQRCREVLDAQSERIDRQNDDIRELHRLRGLA